MDNITGFIKDFIYMMAHDPVRGPRVFLIAIAATFFGIFFFQVIGADLWYDHGYAAIPMVEDIR